LKKIAFYVVTILMVLVFTLTACQGGTTSTEGTSQSQAPTAESNQSAAVSGTPECVSGGYNMGTIGMDQTASSFTINEFGDVYTFSGTAGQVVNIGARGTGTEDDTYLALFGPDCVELINDDDSGDGFSSLISGYTLPVTGTYTIQVRFFAGATGSYDLGLSTGANAMSSSSSSTTSCVAGGFDMGSISFGQTLSSFTINEVGDVYTFSGTAGQVVNIGARGTGTEDDTYLALFGPDCIELINDDDSGDGLGSLISGYTLPATGTYTIQVRFFGGATGSYDIGLSQN